MFVSIDPALSTVEPKPIPFGERIKRKAIGRRCDPAVILVYPAAKAPVA